MRHETATQFRRRDHAPEVTDSWRGKLATIGWCEVELEDDSAFFRLADSLGTRIPSWRGGPLIDKLAILNSTDAPMNSFSYLFGHGAFPFHTDMARRVRPPRYVIMRLSSSSIDVRPYIAH